MDDTYSLRYVSGLKGRRFASACPWEATSSIRKRRRLSVECHCPMLNPSLAIRLPSAWNVVRYGSRRVPSFRARQRGSPGAGNPHAGKYRELTLWRQRGGRGTSTLSLTLCLLSIPKIISGAIEGNLMKIFRQL